MGTRPAQEEVGRMKPVKIREIIEETLGIPLPVIADCIGHNEDVMRHEWNSLNPQTPREVRRFYAEGHGMLWNFLASSGLDVDGTDMMPGSVFNVVVSQYPKGRCLDYGCGLGRYGLIFSNRGWGVTFVDVEGHAFNLVKKWIRLQERENVRFVDIPVDEEYADLGDEQYDTIINMDLLEHVSEPVEMLYFLLRHLVLDGLMCMEVFFDNLSAGGTHEPLAPYHIKRNYERYNDREVWYHIVEDAGLKPIWWDENGIPKLYRKIS